MAKTLQVFGVLLCVWLTPASSQTYIDQHSDSLRFDDALFMPMDQFWSGSSYASLENKLGLDSWYARQLAPAMTDTLRLGAINPNDPNNLFATMPWGINLIAPIDVNVSTVKDILAAYVTPSTCKPDVLRTLIAKLSVVELEELANYTQSGANSITFQSGYSLPCLKMFSMMYTLRRAPYTMSTDDIDIFLPAGLALVPPHMLRGMSRDVFVYMMTELCQSSAAVNPASYVPALQIRGLIEELIMVGEKEGQGIPNAIDLCRCLPYIRRPVIEQYKASFSQPLTMLCYVNNSIDFDFSGRFTEPAQTPAMSKYMSTVYYPPEQCRYSRGPMVEWVALSKIYDKVNRTFYNIMNCFSLDRRAAYRLNNISVNWDALEEVMHKPLSINDREDACLGFRGDYNQGKSMLTMQSVQWLRQAVSCITNFEIRRIPNVYLCRIASLQRFADPQRFIDPDAKWEIMQKCAHYVFMNEHPVAPAPPIVKPVAPEFGDLLQYWPLETILMAPDSEIRRVYGFIRTRIRLMPQPNQYALATAIQRPYNTTVQLNVIKRLCADNYPELLTTTTFLANDTSKCTQYWFLTRSQKIAAAKRILDKATDIQFAIANNNLTWAQLMAYTDGGITYATYFHVMLDSLPYSVYTSFINYEIVDNAIRIVNAHPDLDTNRLRLLSDAMIEEFKRRASVKYGLRKYYLHEMIEPLLDTMPCQLLTNIRPYDISDLSGDLLTCRTISRKWGSCPAILMKTQAYRDYVCNVFMNCGGKFDIDHFVDDLGVYCFCNITADLLSNLTTAQIVRMFPVVSELPNCLSQFARIMLTSKIIDAYPPKSYITSLTPPGQEALVGEFGKLACNLNAAIISERYTKKTLGAHIENLGRMCCFNWTVSAKPLERKLMAGIYFNKSKDDLFDVRKMCDRIYNTTAYVMMYGVEEDEAAARKKRDTSGKVIVQGQNRTFSSKARGNCSLSGTAKDGLCAEPDEFEEEDGRQSARPAVVVKHHRKKRDVTIEGFTWTCPLLKAMTPDALYQLTVDDFAVMKHLDFVRCLPFFGTSQQASYELRTAIITRIRTELSRFFSWCDTDTRILSQLGYTATVLSAQNISCLNLSAEVVAAFGQIETFNDSQLAAIAQRYVNLTLAVNGSSFGYENMMIMGHALCGLAPSYFSINFLDDLQFDSLIPIISRLKNCSMDMIRIFKNRATSSNLYGPVFGWAEEHFVELGLIAAGMTDGEVTGLSTMQLRWLPENVLKQMSFVAKMSSDQMQMLLPEQVRQIWPVADATYPINTTLSADQMNALLVAELDDMYIPPPPSPYSLGWRLAGSLSMLAICLYGWLQATRFC